MSDSVIKNRLSKPIDSLKISKDELRKLLQILQERSNSACEIECNQIQSIVDKENLDKAKEELQNSSILKITINGVDGEELFGTIDEVFDSASFPEKIQSLYVNSELIYKSDYNYYPRNHFELFIDFKKPKVLDFSFEPSDKTPNGSNFLVDGYDGTWVNGVFNEIDSFFTKKSAPLSTIHRSSIYDLLVWFLGIPFGFWACYKVNPEFFQNVFLQSAAYVYVFFFSLIILRIIFHYFRWLYPKVHYRTEDDISMIHRGFFFVIISGIIGTFIYDLIRLIFNQ